MNNHYLSYLMGAEEITPDELVGIGIEIVGQTSKDHYLLRIPTKSIPAYRALLRQKLAPGFWNEYLGNDRIEFFFKLSDGTIKELTLSPQTEREIDVLCADFNSQPLDATSNVYEWLARNSFYHDFMLKNYRSQIER